MTHSPHHRLPTRLVLVATCIAAVLLLIAGCSAADPDAEPRTGSRAPELSTDEIVDEAIEFGQIAIPNGVTVLAASTDTGIDTIYEIALRTDPDGVDRFLVASNIASPLVEMSSNLIGISHIISGPPLETSPSVLETADHVINDDHKGRTRRVVVDERDDNTRYVHVQVFSS